MVTEFTPFQSLAGGLLIGLSAVLLMLFRGRIAGATGILMGILRPGDDWGWRLAFIGGMVSAPLFLLLFGYSAEISVPVSTPMLLIGGFIVGMGVTFGSGCTSGHGVCGMARLSPRSFAATGTFMIATGITVYILRHVLGF